MNSTKPGAALRGRGARANIDHRFAQRIVIADPEQASGSHQPETQVSSVLARSIITRNASPDVGFNLSVNPYQGCEHGCVYCFARPSHAYHDLSPGLDFETRILAKTNAVELFRKELSKPSYACETIAIGVNTDAYQPAERKLNITRGLLETCLEFRQPLALITKSTLILRDLDLLTELALLNLVRISVSVTTLDNELKRRLEPRTAGPGARLSMIERLAAAGVPVNAMVAPIIPRINEREIEHILAAVAKRGAHGATYILLRLPLEVEPLFRDWLEVHYPDRAEAVMHMLEACHRGQAYRSEFHTRMRGQGVYADMIARRFHVARRRCGLARRAPALCTEAFRRPAGPQLRLL